MAAVDLAVLGRTHPDGWGTVPSAIPTIATTILGLLIGRLLMSDCSQGGKVLTIALVGLVGRGPRSGVNPVVPIIMKLWTASYGLASAGWACLRFLAFYVVCDIGGYRKWLSPCP